MRGQSIPVPRVRINSQQELKRMLSKQKQPKNALVIPMLLPKRVKRKYTANNVLLVVFLRYGSIQNFNRVWHRWCEIVTLTGIFESTAREMVLRFHRNGNSPYSDTSRKGRKPNPLPEDIRQYLFDSLYDMRFLSLKQRSQQIASRFNFPMDWSRLRAEYHRMGVTYQPCKTVFKAATKRL